MKARMTGFLVLALACAGIHPHENFRAWGPAVAFAQTSDTTSQTENGLAAAQTLYDQGQFAQAAAALREGLSKGHMLGGEGVKARELLARCQVKIGDAAAGRRTFLSLLHQDPLYSPDPLRVPPDEMAVFNEAKKQLDAERERAAQRIPASIEIHYGIGSGGNKSFGDFVASGGGKSRFDNDPHYGGGVRFAIAPKLSIDIQIERFRATDRDSFRTGGNGIKYEITAVPVSVSLAYLLHDSERMRGYLIVGGGPMFESTASLTLPLLGTPLQVADHKVGTYLQAGLEGEYRVHPRFSITGRLLGRYAKATGLFKDAGLSYVPGTLIDNRDIDFSGIAATIGLRAYVGY
jgi:hypothetical protein